MVTAEPSVTHGALLSMRAAWMTLKLALSSPKVVSAESWCSGLGEGWL